MIATRNIITAASIDLVRRTRASNAAYYVTRTAKVVKGTKPFFALDREVIAKTYIRGDGIEIGALHYPTKVSRRARVRYVDRMSVPDLRKHYPELNLLKLVHVDIVDDGERLETIGDLTQDFVIANHFIEHSQNPIGAIENMLRVLKHGGILYLAVPDKRYTFDIDRPVTTIEHLLQDYEQGPQWSKRQHFEEWSRFIDKIVDRDEVEKRVTYLMNIDYSIHYHV